MHLKKSIFILLTLCTINQTFGMNAQKCKIQTLKRKRDELTIDFSHPAKQPRIEPKPILLTPTLQLSNINITTTGPNTLKYLFFRTTLNNTNNPNNTMNDTVSCVLQTNAGYYTLQPTENQKNP